MQKKTYKLLIILCSGLICFALPAKKLKNSRQPDRPRLSLKENQQKTKPPQAIGVILSFHKWPSEKEQQNISKILNQDGLTLSKKFRSFKALVFSWPKLKTKNKAQKVCRKLSKLKNLNYCEPDALLRPDNASAKSDSKTEAGSPVTTCTADCDNQTISTQNLLSEIQSMQKTTAVCELASSKHKLKKGKLTDYWAQEMVGADLLKEDLEKATPLPEDKHLVAVFDSPKNNHNIHVQNIISHEGPQAVLPALNSSQMKYFQTSWVSEFTEAAEALSSPKESTQNMKPAVKENTQNEESSGMFSSFIDNSLEFFNTKQDSDDVGATEDVSSQEENTVNEIQNMEYVGNFPSFINNSINWGESRTIYTAMSRISPPSILVHSAGNKYLEGSPSLDPIKSAFSKNFDSIIVGSLSPKGVVSKFSQEGEEVHILAPSDYYLTSVDDNGNYYEFGGTSGAAPLVTGGLAGFEWLSGYRPTAQEAKLLLENTAIPTIHSVFEDPKKNGKGMLNAYKLGRVAQRLKDKCNDNHQCFKEEIKNPENYQFSVSQSVLDDVQNAFPKCSDSVEDAPETDCTFKKSAFKKLRQAVLLDTTNVELWKKLKCIYNQEGFSENALAVETTLLALSNLHDHHSIGEPSFRRIKNELIRGIERIGGDGRLQILQILATDKDSWVRTQAIQEIVKIGGEEGLEMLQPLVTDKHPQVRYTVAWAASKIGGDGGLQILQTLATDANGRVRSRVAAGAWRIGGDGELQLLKTLSTDTNYEVRRVVAEVAGKIGGDEGLELLKPLVTDISVEVRITVAWAARKIGGPEGLQILQTLATDTNYNVRRGVAEEAGKMGGDGGLELLQTLATDTNYRVRRGVAEEAGKIGGDGGLELLQTLATDVDDKVRRGVADGAGRIGGDGGLQLLKTLSTDTDFGVRSVVAVEAGKMGGDEGLELLRPLVTDIPQVRYTVVWAARKIGGPEGLQILQTLAQDSAKYVRERAAKEIIRLQESL